MNKATLDYANNVIDAQRNAYENMVRNHEYKVKTKAQAAYYLGMKTMLEIILTEGYTIPLNAKQEVNA